MHITLCIYNTLGVSNNYSCMDTFFSYNEKKKKQKKKKTKTKTTTTTTNGNYKFIPSCINCSS